MSSAPTRAEAGKKLLRLRILHPVYFYPLLPYFISGIQNVTKVENSNKGKKLFALSSDIQEAI